MARTILSILLACLVVSGFSQTVQAQNRASGNSLDQEINTGSTVSTSTDSRASAVTATGGAFADDWHVEGSQWDEWPTRQISFQTSQGTWINLDVSPDASTIVFDLLGDIYRIPIQGGQAELLLGGQAFHMQPRYSPDGRYIVFTSDRGGADNVWVMQADGSNPRQITHEDFRLPSSPAWTPDGEYIVVRKHFTGTRSLGAGELWMIHVQGGSGLQLTERQGWTADQNEPYVSPDGRWVYYSFSGPFDYNRNVHQGIYHINRFDRQTGRIEPVTRAAGGAVRPVPSPDGSQLAFVRRIENQTVLMLRDLDSGSERVLLKGLDHDQQETWAIHGVYPSYAWTPDGREIVLSFGGEIHAVAIEDGQVRTIPMIVEVEKTVATAARFDFPVEDDQFDVQLVRWPVSIPGTEEVVFQAAGRLYRASLPDGTPERLTDATGTLEYSPSVSAQADRVVYATWNHDEGGYLEKVMLGRPNERRRLTDVADQYANPVFSPDGTRIAFLQGTGMVNRGRNTNEELFLNIRIMDVQTGRVQHVTETANRGANRRMPRLQWSRDGSRLYYFESVDGQTGLTSIQTDGSDKTHHVISPTAEEMVLSPDTRYIAFKDMHNVYVAPVPRSGGDPFVTGADDRSVPVRQLTRYGGDWLHWSHDSQYVWFSLGNTLYRQQISELFDVASPPVSTSEDLEDWRYGNIRYNSQVYPLKLSLPVARASGITAFYNARLITMNGDEVIENGTIVVNGNRITAIGHMDDVAIPDRATVYDMFGKTIIPGIVDVHAHMGYSTLDITPDRLWEYEANLAYGITTTHDPSASTQSVFALAEQVKAGVTTGPRIYSTGFILYGAENPNKAVIESLDDARNHVLRHKAVGAISVKSYNQPRRNQRQWVLQAARQAGLNVYPEGGSMLQHNINMIIDGHTGIEHALPVAPLYQDVLALFGVSGVGYTPTLIVGYGGIWGENYWYQKEDVFQNVRLRQFVPAHVIDARARRRIMVPDDEFYHISLAQATAQVAASGGRVQLGSHGQLQGLGAHWELWMFVQGGMREIDALRSATLRGAQYLGLDGDLGSLEPGKLADFVVLNQNPLSNIRHSESIHMVVKNGYIRDADLNLIHPQEIPHAPFRFARP